MPRRLKHLQQSGSTSVQGEL